MEILDLKAFSQEEVIGQAVESLKRGELVIYPTDTIYGIAADATNPTAIDRLLAYKRQRDQKPISVAVADVAMADQYVVRNAQAQALYVQLLPGPYTVVSQSKGLVDARCVTHAGTLGVRIPDYELVTQLARALGKPITATSANPSYKKQPRSLTTILETTDDVQRALVALFLNAGELPARDPSTVLDTTVGEVVVLRQSQQTQPVVEEHITNNAEETTAFGQRVMDRYKHLIGYKSVILALQGEMGAGKTHFTKGIAYSLGIKETLRSPTFVLSQEYPLLLPSGSYAAERGVRFYHMDLWRMQDMDELQGLSFLPLVEQGHIFAIEWADRALSHLTDLHHDAVVVWVDFQYGEGVNERKITLRMGQEFKGVVR